MYNIRFVEHHSADKSLIEDVIRIKSIAWPYSYSDQLNWISKNLKGNDIHVLLDDEDHSIAYMNLIDTSIRTSAGMRSCFGVGNVCSAETGKGYGKELLNHVNRYIVFHQRIGLLFCKLHLIQFYLRNSWILVERDNVSLGFPSDGIFTMIYNSVDPGISIGYEGQPF